MKLNRTSKTNFVVFGISFLAIILLVGLSSGQAFAEPKDKVVLCHQGDSGHQTISVSENAQRAHLAHGDTLGECDDVQEFRDAKVQTSSNSPTEDKVTICHIPPGNPDNAHTISVGSPAVRAHLAHGDVEGSCDSVEIPKQNDSQVKRESRLSEESSQKEDMALERAQRLIEQLEEKVANLEKRLQTLLEKYETGEYYGTVSVPDPVTNTYPVSFDGTATSIYDETIQVEMSGKLFMENLATKSNTSKFKVVSGEIIIGDNLYDVAFGKARASLMGEVDSIVVILQTIDSQDNNNTIKLTLGFDSLDKRNFEGQSKEFVILDKSQISRQWVLDGTGQISMTS